MSEFRLKVFISVARNLSFTQASRELHITQPAISKHVRELELQYGTRLFERRNSQIRLTKAGALLLMHAERLIEGYNLLEFEMNQLNSTFSGELRVGASTTISQYLAPSLLSLFIKRYPHIKLTLISGNTREIEKALEEGRIDLGIVEGNHRQQGFRYLPFMEDEIVLVSRQDSVHGETECITLEQLSTMPLVLREYGSGTLEVIEEKLIDYHYKLASFNIILQMGNTESIKRFLMQTDCVAFVSIRSILEELRFKTLRIIDIENFEITRSFQFITPHGALHPLAECFIGFAQANNKKL